MFRRAIISAFLALTGTLTVSAAPLNPQQKNTAFQAGRPVKSVVLQPAQATLWSSNPQWSENAQVQKIAPLLPAPTRVGISGFSVAKAEDSVVRSHPVNRAGGGK